MPQSLSLVIVHLIFSTKDREPWIKPEMRPRLHASGSLILKIQDDYISAMDASVDYRIAPHFNVKVRRLFAESGGCPCQTHGDDQALKLQPQGAPS
jgi:hypothetical protein